jgi:hypothetical protein
MRITFTVLFFIAITIFSAGCKKESTADNNNILQGTQDLVITIDNQSGLPDDSIFFSVMGLANGNYCWVDTANNQIPINPSDNVIVAGDPSFKYANKYSHSLRQRKVFRVKPLDAARIRFTIGKKLLMHVQDHLNYTDADLNNDSDPNKNTIYDKIEFAYVASGLYINTTSVDYLGIPYTLSAVINGSNVTIGTASTRKEIFDYFTNHAPAAFKELVQGNYRIVAPNKKTGWHPDYFNSYIDSVWNHYKTDSLTITGISPGSAPKPWTAKGKVNASGVFVFSFTSADPAFGNKTVNISKPSSSDVFGCDGALATDLNQPMPHQKLIPKLCGLLNRSVLLHGFDYTNECDTSKFYKSTTTNWFSKILHKSSIDNKCYGFAFDDDCDQSTLFPANQVKALTITITKFK